MAFGPFEISAQRSSMPLRVRFRTDSAMTPNCPLLAPQKNIRVKNAQRSKTVKVLSRGYANESSGASIKARFQKSGSS